MAKLNDILKSIRKDTKAETLEKSSLAEVTDYLDTGSYAINRVLTGSIFKGFPVGRIHTIYGKSQSGKSLLVANTIIQALKQNKVDVVYIFDSEGGVLVDVFKKAGVDMKKINHIPVHSIEDCSTKMLTLYDTLVQAKTDFFNDPDNNDDIRALCVLDSFGALAADKLISDAADKGKMVQDMGLGPKLKNNLMRGLMMRVVQSQATLLVINHSYADPSAMFASKIENMAGGEGLKYSSHVILQCEKLLIKADNNDYFSGNETGSTNKSGFYKGNRLKFWTVKNRLAKPMYSAEVYIDFDSGISKYDGLIEPSIEFGYIQDVRGGYLIPSYSDKRVTYKELVSNSEIWNTFLEDFNKKSIEAMKYSTPLKSEIDKLESELNISSASSTDTASEL